MIFEITHLTRYVYDRPVILDPLTAQLRPRSDLFQRLVSFELAVDPAPSGSTDFMDAEGNAATKLWFHGSSPALTLRATSVVDTLRPNPFDYVVLDPEAMWVPPPYPDATRHALARYLEPPPGGHDPAVAAFAASQVEAAGGRASTFALGLCARIASTVAAEARPEGDPRSGSETLALRRGACRDQAVLFIEACRAAGIAARFVSGYELSVPAEVPGLAGENELHAWAEIYLEGAGWRGYDPSQGLAVADRHVAVATGASHAGAAPTAGSYRGTGVGSRLETTIIAGVLCGAARPGQAMGKLPGEVWVG